MLNESASNSIFALINGDSDETSLEIVPQKHSNIGRFLNSVRKEE